MSNIFNLKEKDWEGTIIHICQNPRRAIWYGIYTLRKELGRNKHLKREVFPEELKPCKCENCIEELEFQRSIQ